MNPKHLDPVAMADSLVTEGGPPTSNATGSFVSTRPPKNKIPLVPGEPIPLAHGGTSQLVFICDTFPKRQASRRVVVRCPCGHEYSADLSTIRCNDAKRCLRCRPTRKPRVRKPRKPARDLTGLKFGWLTVESRVPNRRVRWRCQCRCGNIIEVFTSHLLAGNTVSCGCYIRSLVGEKSPTWNPNLTAEDRERSRLGTKTNLHAQALARKIRKRDNHTCVACGATGGLTHVHHLEPWAHNRKLRFSTANLVTLCADCHLQFHSVYGKDADLTDFEEYLTD